MKAIARRGRPTKGRPLAWNCSPQAAFSRFGEEHKRRPVSLPKVIFTAGQDDAKEAAERIIATRIVRCGRNALEQIGKAETFSAWKDIGAAYRQSTRAPRHWRKSSMGPALFPRVRKMAKGERL
jgi:hypothetical protein